MQHPARLPYKKAIRYFLKLAKKLLTPPVSPANVLDEFLRFYRECRIVGAPVEDGDDFDLLSVECGNYQKITAIKIADYRRRGDSGYRCEGEELQLSMRRTIHAIDELPEDSEFDDDAFDMSIDLYFGPTEDNSSFAMQACTLAQLDEQKPHLHQDPLVTRLLAASPSDTSAHVGGAG